MVRNVAAKANATGVASVASPVVAAKAKVKSRGAFPFVVAETNTAPVVDANENVAPGVAPKPKAKAKAKANVVTIATLMPRIPSLDRIRNPSGSKFRDALKGLFA